jgi:hypothetical protein
MHEEEKTEMAGSHIKTWVHWPPFEGELATPTPHRVGRPRPRQAQFGSAFIEEVHYSVLRSAYIMLITRCVLMENVGRSNRREAEKEWSSLWQVQVPSKIRVFLWCLSQYSLPSTDVLHRRNMADYNNCVLCGAQDSWRHALLEWHGVCGRLSRKRSWNIWVRCTRKMPGHGWLLWSN